MKNLIVIICSLSILIFGCTKEGPIGPAGKDGDTDKQIRFELNRINNGASDTTICTIENSGCGINQFNIDNYVGIDSAVFVVYDILTATGCCGAADINKSVKIELYNLTDKSVISNSMISSDDIAIGTFLTSKNILNDFPHKTIDLGVRMIFDKGYYSSTGKMYLFLYRK